MKFNFKRIASVLTGAAMLSSTVAFAAAADVFPEPFVKNGVADVAVVYGTTAAATDVTKAREVSTTLGELQIEDATSVSSSTVESNIEGEVAPLFTSNSQLYINSTLNAVKNVLTKSDLPTVLSDGTISGNVDAKYTQTLVLGSNPTVSFSRMPTSDDDPTIGLTLSTTTSSPIYNATVTFNKAVNFTHADTKGTEFTMFGEEFTVASTTDGSSLVLLKSAEKIDLSSDSPSATVTVGGNTYQVELTSASDTSATVKVTDSSGSSSSREVNENSAKKIQGLTIAIVNADETNFKYSASIIAGAEKVTLTTGSSVTVGEEEDTVDGTLVTLTGGTTATTKIEVSVAAQNSDEDAVKPGQAFVDPVFGAFKIDFESVNIPEDDETDRETISIKPSGDDRMELTFTDHRGNEKTFQFASNKSSLALQHDSDGRNISVYEGESIYRNGMVVVGNEAEGYLLKVTTITNQTTGYSNDKVKFSDVISGDTYEAALTSEGAGTVTIGGKQYTVNYWGASTVSEDLRYVTLNYPDSTSSDKVAYPTIQTSLGAKLALYEPLSITTTEGTFNIKLPDGDGYQDISVVTDSSGNLTVNSGTKMTAADASTLVSLTTSGLTYNFSMSAANTLGVNLVQPGGGSITNPAVMMIEERDDASNYNSLVVTLEEGSTSDDGIGVNEVYRTWGTDNAAWESTLSSDSDLKKEIDVFGTIVTEDSSESDQHTAIISYPDQQVYAKLYVGEVSATTSSGGSSGVGTALLLSDSEMSQFSDKNLVVVGGSCVNTVAAKLLGSSTPLCGADFTAQTGVGAGEYLIKTYTSPYNDAKIATLVAGYEAQETQNAVDFLLSEEVSTDVDAEYVTGIMKSVSADTEESA